MHNLVVFFICITWSLFFDELFLLVYKGLDIKYQSFQKGVEYMKINKNFLKA